ncbi:MAG TPA: helix-turn-helix domain-containing protein, partial [Ktedonobacterales bacterium]|nr:helix-turn-helix domain-containing protein [Ktedonobacterales bacterium]
EQQHVRNTYKYRLHPTPEQTQALETVLSRCQALYNVALEQRKTWRERSQGKSTTKALELAHKSSTYLRPDEPLVPLPLHRRPSTRRLVAISPFPRSEGG